MRIQIHCVKRRGRQSKRKKKKNRRKYKEKSQKGKRKRTKESIKRKDAGNKNECGGQKREGKLYPTFFKLFFMEKCESESILYASYYPSLLTMIIFQTKVTTSFLWATQL